MNNGYGMVNVRYVAVATTLGIAAASWTVAVRKMAGMNMGVASQLGSFRVFVILWASMMAAMMLPGAAPAIARRAETSRRLSVVPLYLLSYLGVWTVVGVVVFALYRPHGALAAGLAVIAAGAYELTPLKSRFRQHSRSLTLSGFQFGYCCVGSSVGLMLVLVAVDVMSVIWMITITVLILAQKLLPVRAAMDVPVAVAIVTLGVLIIVDPSSIPGLLPPM